MSSETRPIIFENARILDPASGRDEMGALLIADSKIIAAGREAQNQGAPEGTERVDAQGKAIFPGLIDGRCFFGAAMSLPEESAETTSLAAVKGGFTSLIAVAEKGGIPADTAERMRSLRNAACPSAPVRIYPAASLTKNMEGRELTEFGLLKAAGAVALAEGQETLADSAILRRAFQYARDCGLLISLETQDPYLSHGAVMTDSFKAELMGLACVPAEAEIIAVQRDIELARLTGAAYHAANISTAAACAAIKRAKADGLAVSAAASVNNLSFNENDVGNYDTAYRFFPPLRAEAERQALIEGLRQGAIDIITSCHMPRNADAKAQPFAPAAAGAVGLESLFAAVLRLYHSGSVPLLRLIDALSARPARIFGLEGGSLRAGAAADFVIADLDAPWLFDKADLASACKNTAFDKARFQGRVCTTFIGGALVYKHQDFSLPAQIIPNLSI